jgi:Sap, sulfolipid-1-addressing protein
MSPVVGLMLPFAVGIALSPVPIASVILMALSLHPGVGGRLFVAGWALALVAAVLALSLVAGWLAMVDGGRASLARLVLGAVLLVFAWERAGAGRGYAIDVSSPAWVSGLDRLPPDRAFATGAIQAGLDPRKLVVVAAAALLLADAHVSPLDSVIVAGLFAVVGSLGVALPLVVSWRGGAVGRARLEVARVRLLEDGTTIQAVTLLLLAVLLVGQGIAGL